MKGFLRKLLLPIEWLAVKIHHPMAPECPICIAWEEESMNKATKNRWIDRLVVVAFVYGVTVCIVWAGWVLFG